MQALPLARLRHGLHRSRVRAPRVEVRLVVDPEQVDPDHSRVVFQRPDDFSLHRTRRVEQHEKVRPLEVLLAGLRHDLRERPAPERLNLPDHALVVDH